MAFVRADLAGLASFQSVCWSYFDDICAVIASDNMVHFFDSRGNELFANQLKRSGRATQIAWCPLNRNLAIGWNDGSVSLWNSGTITDSQSLLDSPVTVLSWHPNQPLLLSVAENGGVCCWDCSTVILPLFRGAEADAKFIHAEWVQRESPFCFLVTEDGALYTFENVEKPLNNVYTFPKPINVFLAVSAVRKLICISGDNMLTQFNFPPSLGEASQVKLMVGSKPCCTFIRNDVIAYSVSDAVYIWNIPSDESHILRAPGNQTVTSLHFCSETAELMATTSEGSILSWKCTMRGLVSRLGWTNPRIFDSGVKIDAVYWSPVNLGFVASCTGRKPVVFRQLALSAVVSPEVALWQPAGDQIMVTGQAPMKITSNVERVRVSGSYVLVVSQSQAEVFTVRSGGLVPFSRLTPETLLVDISGETIFDCKDSSLECRNLQGTVKQTTNLGNSVAQFLTVNGKYLVVVCSDMNIFLYNISRRQPKLQYTTVFSAPYANYRIRDVALSCGGFAVSITVDIYDDGQWRPSPELFLHSPQFDKTVNMQFDGAVPVHHMWDTEDTRLLCVQTIPYGQNYESSMSATVIVPMFVADSLETYRQTALQIEDGKKLCAVCLPRVFHQSSFAGVTDPPVSAVLPQFEGLDNADESSKKALMDLNFHLATGDIDAAFNAVRGIDNKNIWRSLAQMCAQSRRIDLADLCFGRMEDGGSALLLRHTKELDSDETAAIAVVDSQLGLYDEAKKITRENRRFDILAGVHKSLSEWQDSMSVSTASDRIHLKLLAHQYARSLEIRGDLEAAIAKYEQAGTIQYELPRLALQANDLKLFFDWVSERSPAEVPPRLLLWIGRFYEAHKQVEQAIEFFDYAHADREIVRLNCCIGRWEEAARVVKRSNKRSVICFYARMLIKRIDWYSKPENAKPQIDVDKMKHEVIELFRRARQFAQAMDFALQYEMIDDILALSFSAPSTLVCKAARWFEEQKEAKNAILMYSRAGRMNRALALCFTMKQYDALDEISDTLTSKTDVNVLLRCGQYFAESERWSKAAQCYALARQFDEVINLCNKHNIKLKNSVIKELSEIKADPEVMKRFASLCEQQGEFQTAAQLYVKFKDHLAAMKALIRSGDTEKVVKFANLIRKRETFILAANFLQTKNPREGDKLFEVIVQLYKKAGAQDKLGRFYEAVAQVEIDEYQEYAKAMELIKKGMELIASAQDVKQRDQILTLMQRKAKLISMYLDAQSTVKSDPKHTMTVAVELLRTPQLETVMRSDDVYALMVQASVAQGNFKNAHRILEDLRANGTDITWFMDTESIQKIYAAVGDTYTPGDGGEEDEYDEVDDDALDEVDDDVEDVEGDE